MAEVDVLIPTFARPASLAATLASLIGQTFRPFRVVVSDQTEDGDVAREPAVLAAARVLRLQGRPVEFHKHLPRRGLAEHRQFLLDAAEARYALFLDDDVLLEPDVLSRLVAHLGREGCGFVGAFVNSPSAVDSDKPVDEPPDDVDFEWWDGPVQPEVVVPQGDGWHRYRLHFAAYPVRVARRLGIAGERLYKVAWVGGCTLFDVAKLREVGGFGFWRDLPAAHCGEDVVAQLRVMARFGAAAVHPSGAWHQEAPTTTPDRRTDAPLVLGVHPGGPAGAA